MKTILLAGDSWGIGTYEKQPDGRLEATGLGIQSILESLGYTVVNISLGGSCNWHLIDRLNMNFDEQHRYTNIYGTDKLVEFDWDKIDHVVFLQTDMFREQYHYGGAEIRWRKYLVDEFVKKLYTYNSMQEFANLYFDEYYKKLNNIGKKHNKKILCVGGWGQLHPSIVNYSNLVPVIPSTIQYVIPEATSDWYLNDFEWFVQLGDDPTFMKKFGSEWKQLTIDNSERLYLVIKSWNDHHPNIQGYQKIVDKLIPYFG